MAAVAVAKQEHGALEAAKAHALSLEQITATERAMAEEEERKQRRRMFLLQGDSSSLSTGAVGVSPATTWTARQLSTAAVLGDCRSHTDQKCGWQLDRLLEMGWDQASAEAALTQSEGDVGQAVSLLLQGLTTHNSTEPVAVAAPASSRAVCAAAASHRTAPCLPASIRCRT